jgi:hypothetical protein
VSKPHIKLGLTCPDGTIIWALYRSRTARRPSMMSRDVCRMLRRYREKTLERKRKIVVSRDLLVLRALARAFAHRGSGEKS